MASLKVASYWPTLNARSPTIAASEFKALCYFEHLPANASSTIDSFGDRRVLFADRFDLKNEQSVGLNLVESLSLYN